MRLLVWQWGRRGAGPRYALELARALRSAPGVEVVLSLAEGAEIMADGLPECDLPIPTYRGLFGWAARLASMPFASRKLAQTLRGLRLDGAVCAMPAPLDLLMAAALRQAAVPYAVTVHDAILHPGDILPMQAVLQRVLLRRADVLLALSSHVASQLEATGTVRGRPLLTARLSPLRYGPKPPPPGQHGGKFRLLSFGRLLPYKGLELLADAATMVQDAARLELRVVGTGPDSPVLAKLASLPGVTVENRWVPEAEVGALLAWSDAVILSHTEASQSGVAAAAIAAGRWVIATRVGGLAEQLAGYAGARLVEPDAFALAGAVRDMLTAPPAAEGAARGEGWRQSTLALASQLAAVFEKRHQP